MTQVIFTDSIYKWQFPNEERKFWEYPVLSSVLLSFAASSAIYA